MMQLCWPEFELDGINSGSWYHCLPIRIYHTHNCFTTLLDFVRDYPGEPAPKR